MNRFSCSNPPHLTYPAVIDWHVYDDGERISVNTLVREANRLQHELQQLRQRTEQDYQNTVADFLVGTGRK